MKSPFVLIDGSSYFFRAFHALPPLKTAQGQATGAIYGVVNMIKRLITDYQPHHIAVVFDAKGKTFRHDWYPDYKGHRPPMPEELMSQFEPLIQVLTAMGLPPLIVPGVEADDVIGTLAYEATQDGMPVLISTGDKDMAQLVNQHVTLINTMTNQRLDEAGVLLKFGVRPAQIIDYLALMGDTSDNVPGIPQCGPKTALKWLATYQTLDALLACSDDIAGKIGESLRANMAQLPLSKKLVTIKTDVSLPKTRAELIQHPLDLSALTTLAEALEFKTWLKELRASSHTTLPPISAPTPRAFEIVTEESELLMWLDRLRNSALVCVDTETTDIDALRAEIVGIALAVDNQKPAYIPLMHQDGTAQLDREHVLALLKPLLEDPAIPKVGQNIKYDYMVLQNHGITLRGIVYDTMLESYLLNSTGRHNLDALAKQYLHLTTITFAEVAGKGAKQLRFDAVPVEQAAPYAAEDADVTLQLHHKLYPLLQPPVKAILHSVEVPLLTVLADIECRGVLIDPALLRLHGERLKKQIKSLEDEAYALAGYAFNLNSPKQLQILLYTEQGLPVQTKTPTGQPSTAEPVLQALALDYRLPAVILEFRSLSKLVSTYIDALPKQINPITGRVHTSYNQAVTATGRLSSSDPNLQNIPIRSEEGRLIRRAFIAPPEHCLITADYSQIELRIMAHLSRDPALLDAYNRNLDIHTATASEIFSVPLDDVTAEHRRLAKAVNFGLIYGMSSYGLAKQLGVTRQEADAYIERYFLRYPFVARYMDDTRALAREQGFVETVFGRRLYLPEINARNAMVRKASERTAINAPMQGTAADIIKKAMLAIADFEKTPHAPRARMIMQVHDELVFEVHEADVLQATHAIRDLMEHTVSLSVPLLVSIGIGPNWDVAH